MEVRHLRQNRRLDVVSRSKWLAFSIPPLKGAAAEGCRGMSCSRRTHEKPQRDIPLHPLRRGNLLFALTTSPPTNSTTMTHKSNFSSPPAELSGAGGLPK